MRNVRIGLAWTSRASIDEWRSSGFDSGSALVRATNRPARQQPVDVKLLSGTNGESISGATLLTEPGAFPNWSLRKLYRERDEMLAQW